MSRNDRSDRELNIAILLSGGVGSRITSDVPKQYVRKDGVMMITYVLRTLMASEWIDGVVVVADKAWRDEIWADVSRIGSELPIGMANGEKSAGNVGASGGTDVPYGMIGFADPGENRQGSIFNALEMLDSDCSVMQESRKEGTDLDRRIFLNGERPRTVFIHDAARPYLTSKMIEACFEALGEHDGVLPVLPMKDTVYLSRDGKAISELLDRNEIFAGQAPELFLYEKYLAANRALSTEEMLRINGSTEPAIIAGMDVVMIPGDERNRKVTTDVDMEEWLE